MMRNLAVAEQYCELDEAERALLASSAARRCAACNGARMRRFPMAWRRGLRQIGVMLPYTPLHTCSSLAVSNVW